MFVFSWCVCVCVRKGERKGVCSVGVVGHEQRFTASSALLAALVLAERGESVGASALDELVLALADVLRLAFPRLKDRLLKSASVAERERPRSQRRHLVDGVQVERGVLLRLTAGQEDHARHSGRHGASQRCHRSDSVLLVCVLNRTRLAGGDHVGLEQSALQVDVVVAERLVDGGEHLLGHVLASLERVVAVGQDLRLNDGHQTVLHVPKMTYYRMNESSQVIEKRCYLLAADGVASEHVGVLENGERRGLLVGDAESAAPLGEVGAVALVLGAALVEAVEALGGRLVDGAGQVDGALVDLDAGHDASLLEQLGKRCSVVALLVQCLLEQNDARDVLGGRVRRGEQELTIDAAIVLGVLQLDVAEALADGARALVGGQNALARAHDALGNGGKLLALARCQIQRVR